MSNEPDGPEAADLIDELAGALEECAGVLANIPAPHSHPLWTSMCKATQRAEIVLSKAEAGHD